MGLRIVLRTSEWPSYYKEIMMAIIKSNCGDNALLCSGFFQENFRGSPYRVTDESDISHSAFSRCFPFNFKLTTIGVHTHTWRASYDNFISTLRSSGIAVDAYIKKGNAWHAKIFIIRKGLLPLLGIVGSSNMTSRAFGSPPPTSSLKFHFNVEADVILWDSSLDMTVNGIFNKCSNLPDLDQNSVDLDGVDSLHEVLSLVYRKEDNHGFTESQQLEWLYNKIFDLKTLEKLH